MTTDQHTRLAMWLWLIAAVLALSACTRTVYVPVESVRTVTTTVVDTFTKVVMPPTKVVNTTTDTTSTLTTGAATSTATVNGGVLYHELIEHERVDSLPVKIVTIHEIDSVPHIVEVERVTEITPPWCWWSLLINGITIAAIAIILIGKIR